MGTAGRRHVCAGGWGGIEEIPANNKGRPLLARHRRPSGVNGSSAASLLRRPRLSSIADGGHKGLAKLASQAVWRSGAWIGQSQG